MASKIERLMALCENNRNGALVFDEPEISEMLTLMQEMREGLAILYAFSDPENTGIAKILLAFDRWNEESEEVK